MKHQVTPPPLASALFSWYCRHASVEDLEGDVEELFYEDVKRMTPRRAKLRFWKRILSLMFSYAVRRRRTQGKLTAFASGNSIDLFISYFTIASRSLAKNRFFTIINVAGMAVGMSVSLLFIAMLSYVSRYDEFHEHKEHIHRVITETVEDGDRNTYASSTPLLAEKLQQEMPGIQQLVRINKDLSTMASVERNELPIHGYFADANFFTVFSFTMVRGNPSTALVKPNSIVLTSSTATKFFGDVNPVGKVIHLETWGDFEITGIMHDHPKASHLAFEAIASYATLQQHRTDIAYSEFRNNYTYVLLAPDFNAQLLEQYLSNNSVKYLEDNKEVQASFRLQHLTDIVPGPEHANQIGPEWGYASFTIFGLLTLLILVPACFNYTNISISRMLKRAKEIGLRKTVGGSRQQIFMQFIAETVLVSLIALLGAFLIFTQIREEFLSMLVSRESLELVADLRTISLFIVFSLATGFIAGVIPAAYFSRLNPIRALKNSAGMASVKGVSFRKVLIVGQFALSLGFIMAVVIVIKQYRTTLDYNFGFAQENILDVELQGVDKNKFKTEFSRLSAVSEISMSSGILGTNGVELTHLRRADVEDSTQVAQFFVDENFLSNLDVALLAGENFPSNTPSAENAIIVNEEFARRMKKLPHDVLGQTFMADDTVEVRIIGVVKDFHYASLREQIGPFMFRHNAQRFEYANLKLSSTGVPETFSAMESTWRSIAGETKFRSKFFADEIEDTYSFYFSMIKICGFLGILAITISCLGLLGMVVYTAESRTKELGVRKVMGASVYQLALLLSKGFLNLMAMGILIATPLTYMIFSSQVFKMQYYTFEIGSGEIAISILITLGLGAVTVLSQTIKAARNNPVDTLRSE